MKRILSLLALVVFLFAIAGLTACGGGGTVTGNPSPTPTTTPTPAPASVAVTPATSTITTSQTQQFTAVVSPAGASQSVTWSASGGTISASGLFTPPAGLTVQTNFNITAKSTVDPTKVSPAAVVTVIVSRTITLNPGKWKVEFDGQSFNQLSLTASVVGNKPGDTLQIDPLPPAATFAFSGSTLTVNFLADQTVQPRKERVRFCDSASANCSNWANFVLVGNGQNQLFVTASGTIGFLDQGTGILHEYSAPASAGALTQASAPTIGALAGQITFDEASQLLVITVMPIVNETLVAAAIRKLDGSVVTGTTASGDAMGVASKNKLGIFAQPTAGLAQGFTLTATSITTTSAATGGTPWAAARATIGAEEDGLVLLRGNATTSPKLQKYALPAMTKNATELTFSTITGGGSPQLVAFGPTAAAGAANKAAVRFGTNLFIINVATMTVDHTVVLPSTSLSGPVQIYADEVHGVVIVSSYDSLADTSSLLDVNVASGSVGGSYGSTSTFLYGLGLAAGSPFVVGGNTSVAVAISFQ